MPTVQQFSNYVNGKGYKRATEQQIDLGEFSQYLVDNKKDSKFLFCKLTAMKVLKKKSAVEKHLNGKNFRKRVEEIRRRKEEEGQANGKKKKNKAEEEEVEEEEIEDMQKVVQDEPEETEKEEKEAKESKVMRKKKIKKTKKKQSASEDEE